MSAAISFKPMGSFDATGLNSAKGMNESSADAEIQHLMAQNFEVVSPILFFKSFYSGSHSFAEYRQTSLFFLLVKSPSPCWGGSMSKLQILASARSKVGSVF